VRTRCFAGDFQPPTPYQPGQDVSRWGIAMRRKQGVRCVVPLPVAHQEPAHQDWVASGCIPHTGLRVALHGPRLAALPRGACDCRPRCLWLMKTVWRRGAARSLHARSSIVPWLALRGRMPPCGLHPQAWNHPRVRDVTACRRARTAQRLAPTQSSRRSGTQRVSNRLLGRARSGRF
jgi:hypothetical protein